MTARNPLEGLFTTSFEKPCDLLCCAFGLKSIAGEIYFSLLSGTRTVEQIAEDKNINRDRSVVQRALYSLEDNGLVERQKLPLDRGGYYYVWKAIPSPAVKRQIIKQLDDWYKETRRFLSSSWPEQTE
jgi:predicted transcriptional regulator